MRAYLLSLIPWTAGYFALTFGVYSYTGEFPNLWMLVAAFFFGVAAGMRKFL